MVKAGILPSISKDTWQMKWTHFQKKGIMSKNYLNLRLKFAGKVYCKRATCNCEI